MAPASQDRKWSNGKDTVSLNDAGLLAFTVDEDLVASDRDMVLTFKVNHPGFTGEDNPYLYKNKTWYRKGSPDALPFTEWTVIETSEHKNILGYDCIKFIGNMSSPSKQTIEIWAAPAISHMALPITGVREFKYGILEMRQLEGMWDQKATKIEFLQ